MRFWFICRRIRNGSYAVLVTCAAVAIPSGAGHSASQDKSIDRYATRQGNVIEIYPSRITFQVPESWQQKARFVLAAREVEKAEALLGMQIADGALNRRDCAAQIEADNQRWLRAYVVDGTEEEILKRIHKKGRVAAAKMPNYVQYDGHVTKFGASLYEFKTIPTKEGAWEQIDIPYTLNFGDYDGDGYVSFYLRQVAGKELVLAVGFFATDAGPPDERQNLLKAVGIPNSLTQTEPH